MVFNRKLTKKELHILNNILEFVRYQHNRSEGHDYSHILEVTRLTVLISKKIKPKVDPFIVISGALLHDIGRVNNPNSVIHGIEGAALSEEFLESLIEDNEIINKIEKIIVRHSPTSMIRPQSTEEKVVFDADTIERLGFMGMIRGIMGKTGTMESICEDRIAKRLADYNKLFFNESKIIAGPYHKETLAVVKSLRKGLKTRAKHIKQLGIQGLAEK